MLIVFDLSQQVSEGDSQDGLHPLAKYPRMMMVVVLRL